MKCISAPMYYIENDWESILSKIGGEIWIMSKFKDKSSKDGKVVRIHSYDKNNSSITVTEGFSANLLTYNAIKINSSDSEYSCIFVAPRSVYSTIHNKSVTSLDISKNSICASVSLENESSVVVWSTDKETKLITFTEHLGTIYKCKWFPSGKVLLSCGADMNLKIWCSETGRCPVSLIGHTKAVTDVAFVDRGRNVISVSKDGYCKLWNCGEAKCIDNLTIVSSAINCCSVSTIPEDFILPENNLRSDEHEIGTENKILLIGSENGEVRCIAVRSRKSLFSLNLKSAINCAASIKPALFVVGCHNGNIYLLSAGIQNPILTLWQETNSPVLCILPYKEKGFFAGHNDGSFVFRSIINVNSPVRLALTGSDGDPIYDACSDDKFIYTACRDSNIRRYSPHSYIERHLNEEL